MPNMIQVLQFISSISVPACVLILLLIYKGDISRLLSRVNKGKFFGQELEMTEERLVKGQKAVESIALEIHETDTTNKIEFNSQYTLSSRFIMKLALSNPRLALMHVMFAIHQAIQEYVIQQGVYGRNDFFVLPNSLQKKMPNTDMKLVNLVLSFWEGSQIEIFEKEGESEELAKRYKNLLVKYIEIGEGILGEIYKEIDRKSNGR